MKLTKFIQYLHRFVFLLFLLILILLGYIFVEVNSEIAEENRKYGISAEGLEDRNIPTQYVRAYIDFIQDHFSPPILKIDGQLLSFNDYLSFPEENRYVNYGNDVVMKIDMEFKKISICQGKYLNENGGIVFKDGTVCYYLEYKDFEESNLIFQTNDFSLARIFKLEFEGEVKKDYLNRSSDENNNSDETSQINLSFNTSFYGRGNLTISNWNNSAYLSGKSGYSSYQQILDLHQNHPEINTLVFLDVSGTTFGEINDHLAILIRKLGYNTIAQGKVFSGGVDLFLGGVNRKVLANSQIGIHSWCCIGDYDARRVSLNHPSHQWKIRLYNILLGNQGQAFYEMLLDTSNKDINLLTQEELLDWKIITD